MTAKHHQLLLDHLIGRGDAIAAAHLVEILLQCPSRSGIDWENGRIVAFVQLTGAYKANSKAQKDVITGMETNLANLLAKDGVRIPPTSTVAKKAAGEKLGEFLTVVAKKWNDKQKDKFQSFVDKLPANTIIQLGNGWKGEVGHNGTGTGTDVDGEQIKLLLAKNVTEKSMAILRKGRQWSTQEADLYLTRRLWPDWKEDQSITPVKIATDTNLATDSIALATKISPQAWVDTVFSEKYSKSGHKLLQLLGSQLYHSEAGRQTLNLPDPPEQWQREHLQKYGGGAERNLVDQVLIDRVIEAQVRVFEQKDYIDWELIRRVSDSNTVKKSEVFIHPDLVLALSKKMNNSHINRPPIKSHNPNQVIFTDMYWAMTLPNDQLSTILKEWPRFLDEHRGDIKGAAKNDYNSQMAMALWERMKKLKGSDPNFRQPELTRAFWHHALGSISHLSRGLRKILPEMLDPGNGVHHLLWDVGTEVVGYPRMDPEVIISIGVKGRVSPQVASATKAMLLKLATAAGGKNLGVNSRAGPRL